MPLPEKSTTQKVAEKEKRIDAAVSFARKLQQILSSNPADAPATDELVKESKTHIDKLFAVQQTSSLWINGRSRKQKSADIEDEGTRLWNVCTRLRRDLSGPSASANVAASEKRLARLYLHGRVLAFHLLGVGVDIALGGSGGTKGKTAQAQEMVRLLRLALKTARSCIDLTECKLATPILQRAADFKGRLQDLAPSLPEEEVNECNRLEVEYFIIRTALCWAEDKLEVAEHMFTKAERLRRFLTPDYAEKLADVLYEIGKSLLAREDFPLATKWLQRANEIINDQNLEQLSREGIELRLAILQALVTALLGTNTPDGLKSAEGYVSYIESEVGNRPVVLLLKLELLQKTPAEIFDDEAYGSVLRRMIRDFQQTDSAYKLIMHHVRKLHDKSPGAGCAVLDDFILALRAAENDNWMERAVVTRMWMITNQRDSVDTIKTMNTLLSHLTRPLSADGSIAAQALVWKKIESSYGQGQYDLSESWCHLALHAAFRNCGPSNISKIERKLLLCSLAKNDMDSALSTITKMSESSRREPMTAYLAFKVAIRAEDRSLAEESLQTLSSISDHIDYLGACIAESQKAGDIFCAIAALKKLQEKHEDREPNPIHLPAVLRCIIRLLIVLLNKGDSDREAYIEELCLEFETVVACLEREAKESSRSKLFNVQELDWFSRNSYNLALKNTTRWDLRSVVRMLTACVNIIAHFPASADSPVERSLKSLFARFIIVSALVSLARTQDNVEQQQHDYVEMRRHVMAFDRDLPEHLPGLVDENAREDMIRKHAVLLTFDFESAIVLGHWDDLGGIVQRAVPCRSVAAYQAMADNLLRATQAPGRVLYSTMRKIVNEIWVLESFDAIKLSKYTRCLFMATLPLDDTLAIKLLDEACNKARELQESDVRWPEEELEWMASMAFNHAIDLYGVQEMDRAKEWATKAINLAHYCSDEGGLEKTLQTNFLKFNFERRVGGLLN